MAQNIQVKPLHILAAGAEGVLDLRCGRCSGMTFAIQVQMHLDQASIFRCKCDRCGQIRGFDDHGVLQTSGKVNLKPRKIQ